MHFYFSTRQLLVSEQLAALKCPRCYRWFRSAGRRAVHRCKVSKADSVLVPTSSPIHELVTTLHTYVYITAHVIADCVGDVFEGYPGSPGTTVDVVNGENVNQENFDFACRQCFRRSHDLKSHKCP